MKYFRFQTHDILMAFSEIKLNILPLGKGLV